MRTLGARSGDWGPAESLCGSWSALYEAGETPSPEAERPVFRHVGGESQWFPQPEGCVLLAACRADELARERSWGSEGYGGAFTHHLLTELRALGEDVSYTALLRSVRQRIRALWREQTPWLEGDGELQFLGAGRKGGTATPPGLGGPVPLDAPDGAGRLVGRLEHLAHYRRVRDLAPPSGSGLRGGLRLDLFQVESKADWQDPAARRAVEGGRVPTGLLLCMLVRNTGERALNGIVLDLRPDGAIERVHPSGAEGELALLEPGIDHPVFLRTWLPAGTTEATSLVKVIASVDPITADGYVLPALGNGADSPVRSAGPRAHPEPGGDLWTTQEPRDHRLRSAVSLHPSRRDPCKDGRVGRSRVPGAASESPTRLHAFLDRRTPGRRPHGAGAVDRPPGRRHRQQHPDRHPADLRQGAPERPVGAGLGAGRRADLALRHRQLGRPAAGRCAGRPLRSLEALGAGGAGGDGPLYPRLRHGRRLQVAGRSCACSRGSASPSPCRHRWRS